MESETWYLRASCIRTGGGVFGAIVMVAVPVLCLWGDGQSLQPSTIQPKLVQGMSLREAEYSLAMPTNSLVSRLERASDGTFFIRLAKSGLGSWFVPQYEVTLTFTPAKRLERCLVELHWRLDEVYLPTPIPSRLRSRPGTSASE